MEQELRNHPARTEIADFGYGGLRETRQVFSSVGLINQVRPSVPRCCDSHYHVLEMMKLISL